MNQTNMSTALAMLEQRIVSRLANEGIAVQMREIRPGPQVLMFVGVLLEPTARVIERAKGMAGVVEAAAGLTPAFIAVRGAGVEIELPTPWPYIQDAERLRGQGWNVPLGVDGHREIVGINMEQTPHMAFVGPTGSGKSVGMWGMILHLARQQRPSQVGIIGLCSKLDPNRKWVQLDQLAHVWAVETEPHRIALVLRWLRDEMRGRNPRAPRLLVFVDDVPLILSQRKDVGDLLDDIAGASREARIHLILGAQRAGKDMGGAFTAANTMTRVTFAATTSWEGAMNRGRGGSEVTNLSARPGSAVLGVGPRETRFTVAYIEPSRMLELLPKGESSRPWDAPVHSVPALAPTTGAPREEAESAPVQPAPLLPGRSPLGHPDDLRVLEELRFKQRLSINKVIALAYGAKNPTRLAWATAGIRYLEKTHGTTTQSS